MQPSDDLAELAKAMISDAWGARAAEAKRAKSEWARQLKDTGKQIDDLLDRVVEATNSSVIRAYEERVAKLDRRKFVLRKKIASVVPSKEKERECIELALEFLSNPWNIYKNGDYASRRLVLRLAFSEPLRYCLNRGLGTPEISFPFRVLKDISNRPGEMVL